MEPNRGLHSHNYRKSVLTEMLSGTNILNKRLPKFRFNEKDKKNLETNITIKCEIMRTDDDNYVCPTL